ncbi:GntR family transcriptional regulator [Oerskovia turbata]|uniref:GntR family transcriptional regulator n=1 Tax=Oerskovia turbata TaxID=1713 RepID=A0A4Q1L3E7_9CELL|nr:GntR family transcriptional regulator [Oerskovia turbata]RXR26187.1 GntR family transcriptional regulator [Oerskovia turbata]RXR36689.1 GntR family transcriptional regulator [Oerskovia turbata]
MSADQPFEPEADRVARIVREQIIDGDRAPGDRLVERDLAAELGVSRVPVRDALKVLIAEGLVTPRPRTWAVVRTFTDADVDDLIEVRSALETLTFRLAADRRTPDAVAALEAVLDREARAAREHDAKAAHRAGADFHELVATTAASPLLDEIGALTASRLRWLLGQHLDLQEMVDEHRALLAAIRAGDGQEAARLAVGHVQTSRDAARARRAARGTARH